MDPKLACAGASVLRFQQRMRYQDIFVPGGFPRYTYNPREELRLEQRLSESKDNLCKLVTVTGQTKSGKTVLTKRIFPTEDSVWIDGGTVSQEEDFWQVIIDTLELFQSTETEESKDVARKIEGTATAEANFLVAKGTGQVGTGIESTRGSSVTVGKTLNSRVVALRGLRQQRVPLVIDDFHYIPRDMQGSIVRALKPLVFEGLPVVIIAIPHRRYDALKVEKEMTGRISPIEIQPWSESELRFIPQTGFELLNCECAGPIYARVASEAIGSPHLMQDFCRGISKLRALEHRSRHQIIDIGVSDLESVFRDVAETIGRPIFEKLARGPRQRTDRMPRELIDGQQVDIYELVLHGLAHIRPGLVSIEYEDLRAAIREVSASAIPRSHEVSNVLKHMATIAATDQSSTPVIEYDEEDRKLHITDPFFAFYLRWGELVAGTN